MMPAALGLGHGQCAATERHPAVVRSGRSEPLNGAKVQTIQKMIAAGGVAKTSSSGPSVVRTKSTMRLSLGAAQVASVSLDADSDIAGLSRAGRVRVKGFGDFTAEARRRGEIRASAPQPLSTQP